MSYLEEVLSHDEAIALLREERGSRKGRESILQIGYPGYDTSVGWMGYDDAKVRALTKEAIDRGFKAFKLKVGSDDETSDLRRASMLREVIGNAGTLMFDANQRWNAPDALHKCCLEFRYNVLASPSHTPSSLDWGQFWERLSRCCCSTGLKLTGCF